MSDGRCTWAVPGPMRDYHDTEWGQPVRGDQALFERICLEAFQAGLSWRTVLLRRPYLREVFGGFDPKHLADCDEAWIERVLQDRGIIRNRAKVRATVINAQACVAMEASGGPGTLDALVWRYARPHRRRPHAEDEIPSQTPQSAELASRLRAFGFVHIGPTTVYALMQACGLVNDHVAACPVEVAPC